MGTQLYQVNLRVTPNPGSPSFWNVDSALVEIYFFADSEDDAISRCKTFASRESWTVRDVRYIGRIQIERQQSDLAPGDGAILRHSRGAIWRATTLKVGNDPASLPGELNTEGEKG